MSTISVAHSRNNSNTNLQPLRAIKIKQHRTLPAYPQPTTLPPTANNELVKSGHTSKAQGHKGYLLICCTSVQMCKCARY